jgi:hypothetical protein
MTLALSCTAADADQLTDSAPPPAPPPVIGDTAPPVDTVAPPPVDTVIPPPTDTVTPPPVDTVIPPPTDTVTPPPVDTVSPPPVDTVPPPPTDTVTPPPVDTVSPPPPPVGSPTLGLNGSFGGRAIFPAGDPWNQPVSGLPVDPNSLAIMTRIGLTDRLHPDFGSDFGIPYIVVPDTLTRSPVSFDYADESDPGPYPIPANPPIEDGGDRHLLVVVQGEYKLYELYNLRRVGNAWRAGSGAIFNLAHGTTRPAGWTSADAAGLPILPGLVRYDEVYEQGEIRHAIRFTVSRTRRAYIPPATHYASSSTNPLDPPMGMRIRLKASFDDSGYSTPMRAIIRALKTYGMIVADNGSDMYVTGTADARWNNEVNNALKQLRASDFEVVQMTGVIAP